MMNQQKDQKSQYQSQLSFTETDENILTGENINNEDSSDGTGESDEDETRITNNNTLTFRKETTAKNVQEMFQIQNEKFDSKLDFCKRNFGQPFIQIR